MKKTLILVIAMLFVATTAFGAASTQIKNSKHDLSNANTGQSNVPEICVACHTPHQAPEANYQYPLWNHSVTSQSFTMYDSPTLNATIQAMSAVAPAKYPGGQSVTMLCMGCHDGSVAVLSMYNPPNSMTLPVSYGAGWDGVGTDGKISSTATTNIGTDLSNDHPVNFTYDSSLATIDGGLVDPSTNATILSWLVGDSLQCSSCHDVHNPSNAPFLRISNLNSALCLTCHVK